MKTTTKKSLAAMIALSFVTSMAWSGDHLVSMCQYCQQTARPTVMCSQSETPNKVEFCGAENWEHNFREECKQFDLITVYCASGATMRYTDERWMGAGTACEQYFNTGNHHCY